MEFRHRSWLDESSKEIDPAALEALRERNVANVLIDGPGLHVGTEQTADHAYVRFHDMLSIEHKSKEIHLQDQSTLGEF